MTSRSSGMRMRALRQGVGAIVAVAMVAAAVFAVERRPADAKALRAEVSVLRSQAAEAELSMRAAPDVGARFARAHAEQSERNVARERDRIAALRVLSSLESEKRAAVSAADRLDAVLGASLHSNPPVGDVTIARALTHELEALERALQARER